MAPAEPDVETSEELYSDILKASSRPSSGEEKLQTKYTWAEKPELGKGTFGLVLKAYHNETKDAWAVKRVNPEHPDFAKGLQYLRNEAYLMRGLSHDHIVKVAEHFEGPDGLFLVMELCPGGDLYDLVNAGWTRKFYMERMRFLAAVLEQYAAAIIRPLMGAAAYLHARGIVHGDISPNQVLFAKEKCVTLIHDALDRGVFQPELVSAKLCDFGTAFSMQHHEPSQRLARGTPGFRALDHFLSTSSDVFSLGAVMWFILTATAPQFFAGPAGQPVLVCPFLDDIVLDGRRQRVMATWWEHVSDSAKDLALNMLRLDQLKRPSAQAALLYHRWLAPPS